MHRQIRQVQTRKDEIAADEPEIIIDDISESIPVKTAVRARNRKQKIAAEIDRKILEAGFDEEELLSMDNDEKIKLYEALACSLGGSTSPRNTDSRRSSTQSPRDLLTPAGLDRVMPVSLIDDDEQNQEVSMETELTCQTSDTRSRSKLEPGDVIPEPHVRPSPTKLATTARCKGEPSSTAVIEPSAQRSPAPTPAETSRHGPLLKLRRPSPVSQAPVSQAFVSRAPVSQAPASQAAVSQAPVSQAPVSDSDDDNILPATPQDAATDGDSILPATPHDTAASITASELSREKKRKCPGVGSAGWAELRPMFDFECRSESDWPRSPAPQNLSCSKRRIPLMDPEPLYTPPGYCPRQYTGVILRYFDDYLARLYQWQCDHLPRRHYSDPVEAGRAVSGSLDAWTRRRPRDLSERLEQYHDWRADGGTPTYTSPEPGQGQSSFTYPCDVHGLHSISTTMDESTQRSDSLQSTPELELESPVNERKRKLDSELPDTWFEEEPRSKRPQVDLPDLYVINEFPDHELSTEPSIDEDPGEKTKKMPKTPEKKNVLSKILCSVSTTMNDFVGGKKNQKSEENAQKKRSRPRRKPLMDSRQMILNEEMLTEMEGDDDDEFEAIAPSKRRSTRNSQPVYTDAGVDEVSDLYAQYLVSMKTAKRPGASHQTSQNAGRAVIQVQPNKQDQDVQVSCPLCGDQFSMAVIERHAALCDGTSQSVLNQHQYDFRSPTPDVAIWRCPVCDEEMAAVQMSAHLNSDRHRHQATPAHNAPDWKLAASQSQPEQPHSAHVQSIEIHDSSSSDDEPSLKRGHINSAISAGSHGNVTISAGSHGNVTISAGSHGKATGDNSQHDPHSESAGTADGWLNKQEGKVGTEVEKKTKLRRKRQK